MKLMLKKSFFWGFEVCRSYILQQMSLFPQEFVVLIQMVDFFLQSFAYLGGKTLGDNRSFFNLRLIT